jgi:hypothetical protein
MGERNGEARRTRRRTNGSSWPGRGSGSGRGRPSRCRPPAARPTPTRRSSCPPLSLKHALPTRFPRQVVGDREGSFDSTHRKEEVNNETNKSWIKRPVSAMRPSLIRSMSWARREFYKNFSDYCRKSRRVLDYLTCPCPWQIQFQNKNILPLLLFIYHRLVYFWISRWQIKRDGEQIRAYSGTYSMNKWDFHLKYQKNIIVRFNWVFWKGTWGD